MKLKQSMEKKILLWKFSCPEDFSRTRNLASGTINKLLLGRRVRGSLAKDVFGWDKGWEGVIDH